MRFNRLKGPPRAVSSISIAVCLSIVALAPVSVTRAADKPGFQAKPADSYVNKQTSEGVTIAAETFITDDQAKEPFGKLNPWRYNILPILVVIRNGGTAAVNVASIHFQYELPDRSRSDAIPAADVKYTNGPGKPKASIGPMGGVKIGKTKNPLAEVEIENRAFAAKMIPPGETASGFVYFETDITSVGASLYVTGLRNASTGKELYYFEIPLAGK